MKKITFSLILIFVLLLSGQICLSQTNSIINNLQKADAERRSVPKNLPMLGAKTYEIQKIDSNQMAIKLFNEANENIATLNLTENLTDHSILFSLSETSGQDWVRISKTHSANEIQVSTVTSSGSELLTKVTVESINTEGKARISSLDIKVGGTTWQNFPTGGLDSPEQRSTIHQAFLAEDQRLFNTARLRKLKECLRGLDVLNSATSSVPSERLDASCAADDVTPPWGEPMPAYRPPRCGGSAFCYRMATIIPIFNCNGADCSGVYIIYDWVVRIFATASCAYLLSCA